MKTSVVLFVGSLFLAISSYVGANSGIKIFTDLLQVQNFFGLVGVIGGVLIAWASKSPIPQNGGPLAKVTGNGSQPVPVDKSVN